MHAALRTFAGVAVTIRAEGLVRRRDSDPADYRETLTGLLTGPEADLSDPAWTPVLARSFDAIQRGDQVLMALEPVFGAGVMILAARVSVQAGGST